MLQAGLYCLVFFACTIILARIRSPRVRQAVLLIASYALYLTWTPWFLAVLFASTLMNYFVGQWLRRRPSALPLWTGILLNLGFLAAFKYAPEVAVSLPLSSLQKFSHLALPLGLSFWTFQALSYLFDLYREEQLDPTFAEFALYMSFFPVTISGPVCRMPDMLPQFRSPEQTSWSGILQGARRIAIGIFMMQVARLLGQGILAGDGIASGFDHASRWTGADVWCLVFGFALQLFFDFAGYTHIAIGASQALGLSIPENFQGPFASLSPSMFWTRWHMSLSFWIRDYVFLPLAVFRPSMWWRNVVLALSMVIFGLWHRASLLFLIWGCYHGVLLVAHRQIQGLQRRSNWEPPARLWTALSWFSTMLLISLGWIFFRANSLAQARQMVAAVLSPASYSSHFLTSSLYALVAALAIGYAIVSWTIDRLESAAEDSLAFRWRWYWIVPLYSLALLFLLIVTLSRGLNTAQLMYGNF